MTDRVSKGWDTVNQRIESQQQKHVAVLYEQQLDQQARLQAQLDQMANAADKIQQTLTKLSQQTETMQLQVNQTFSQTNDSLQTHLAGVESGLSSLGSVLEKLDGQVVVQQVEADAKKGWFGKSRGNQRRK